MMEEKKPIDRKRESGGYADIGSKEEGAIMEMRDIGGRALIIKERAIYEMVMADTIDPKRTNINLPTTIQKLIIDKGTESEIVSRTLLTAMTLFNKDYIVDAIDCKKIISLAIDLLSEISILEKEIKEYQLAEDSASNEYEERKKQLSSYKLPSVVSLESKCKTIFQKADHVEQTLMDIIVNFYPNIGLTKQSHFPNLHQKLKEKYGKTDSFVLFIGNTIHFMQVIRELRNGLDHRLDHTKVLDYELQTNGDIISPTIELQHKKIKLERTSLHEFLDLIFINIIDIVELTFAFLAKKNVRKNGIPHLVREIPENKRRNQFIRYCFWSPLGDEGYYNQ